MWQCQTLLIICLHSHLCLLMIWTVKMRFACSLIKGIFLWKCFVWFETFGLLSVMCCDCVWFVIVCEIGLIVLQSGKRNRLTVPLTSNGHCRFGCFISKSRCCLCWLTVKLWTQTNVNVHLCCSYCGRSKFLLWKKLKVIFSQRVALQ